jgi:hypothetical protein
MTVKQAIKLLSKMPDKTIEILIDCPHCGRGCQLAKVGEYVVMESKKQPED